MTPAQKAASILAWAVVALLLVVLCYFSLGHYDHNDHMYAVAPVLAARLRPYTDFAYVQTPLSLVLYEFTLKLVGEVNLYTALRVLSLTLNLLIILLGVVICRRNSVHKTLASVFFVGLYLSYRPDCIIGAEIGNYTLSLGLTAAALVWLDVFRGKAWTPLVVGLLAGLALSAKLSYIYALGGFALIVLVWERAPRNPIARMASFGLGALLGVTPILFYLLSDFDRFLFENVHFHYLSNLYRGITPLTGLASLPVFSASSGLLSLTLLALVCGLIAGAALALLRLFPRLRTLMLPLAPIERDILCIAAALIIGAVTPGIIFKQYRAGPAFALILFAALYLDRLWISGRLTLPWSARARVAVPVLALLLAVWQAYGLTRETVVKQRDGVYGVVAVAHARAVLARTIAAIDLAHPHCHDDMVTAFGVPAVGSGAMLSPISSAGSFAMRLDDIFARRAPNYRWISDPSLYLTPRSLILSGFYIDKSYEPKSPFEAVMDGYAASHGFEAIPVGPYFYRPIVLYVPPACRIAQPAVG